MSVSQNKDNTIQEAKVLAAIDVGSTSIRLVIGQVYIDGRTEILERLQRTVRLGQDTFRRGRLRGSTIRAAVMILRDYLEAIKTYQTHRTYAVATSAVREAANSEIFLDRVLMATGLEIKVITPAEESRLTVSAVRHAIGRSRLAHRNTLIAEVGGGSTVLTLLKKGDISATQSLAIGSVRTREALAATAAETDRGIDLIRHEITAMLSTVEGVLQLGRIGVLLAVGGDARWAAAQIGKQEAQELYRLGGDDLEALIAENRDLTPEETAQRYDLSYSDAEALVPALTVYSELLHATRAQDMLVATATMRDGLMQEMALELLGKEDPSFAKEVLDSAMAVAEKYHVDIKHAIHIRQLAIQLYDQMLPEQQSDRRHRLLLEVAALLHEVGAYVSSRARHKHTYYIVSNTEIFGLTRMEVTMVAHIARYHRRSRPKRSHIDYLSLPRERRVIVNRLAALLRVADALDASRSGQIRELECRVDDDGLVIFSPAGADLVLEQRDLKSKGDMFEDVFGLTIRLEPAGR